MKKKVVIGVGAAIVFIAIAAMLVFVFSGKDEKSPLDVSGTWKVVTNVSGGVVSIPESEYMVFSEGEAADYRDGDTEPYAKSKYSISGNVLKLQDMSRTYNIEHHTDEYISLYTNDNTFITLIKVEKQVPFDESFNAKLISGKWNVAYRPTDKPIFNEYLLFGEDLLSDYRDDVKQPAVEAKYEWEGNIIKAPELGIEMMAAKIEDGRIVLIDMDAGYVWLLIKAEE